MNKPKTLTARFVQTVRVPDRYGDGRGGHGLILNVHQAGNGRITRSWIQRVRINGSITHIGLGAYPVVSLAEARQAAIENLRALRQGRDPRGDIPTFEQALEATIAVHAAGWKDSGKSQGQWNASMQRYVLPALGSARVDRITTGDILAILVPVWHEKNETARRVKSRIAATLKWSVANGYRLDNPAGEALTATLPKIDKPTAHHKALPFAEVSAALEAVRRSTSGQATKALFEFVVLTACRSGEARGARWDEINFENATWTIPAARMKTGRAHRVPLAGRVVVLLEQARRFEDGSGFLFPSPTGRAMSDSTLSKALRENGIQAVPHGFRASFRQWAAECTDAPREVCEIALAHVAGGSVERAYQRSDLFDRRRALMQQWADYLELSR